MTPQLPATPLSKLAIRNKVLATIQQLSSQKSLSTSEQQRCLQRLKDLGDLMTVQDVLIKELERATHREQLDTIGEIITRIGRLQDVQDPLWLIIEHSDGSDILKDTANLILRQLGDRSEPEKYMQFLDDPEQLIHQEMERTLLLSMSEPQALVDFIDFIVSLKPENQEQLLDTLKNDFDPHARTQLYQAILESLPNKALSTMAIQALGETGTSKAAEVLSRLATWPDEKLPGVGRSIQTALKKLQLLGVYHPQKGVTYQRQETPLHPLVINSTPNECFATIPDGLGNQGLLLSRKNPDNSFSLIGVAIHDQQGIVDSFGFQDLNATDVQRFIERFYESGLKTPVTPEYFAYKVTTAEQKTLSLHQRLPYEYRAWSVLISDITPYQPDYKKLVPTWADDNWESNTNHLYQHPEFRHWFIEYGDLMFANDCFKQVEAVLQEANDTNPLLTKLDGIAAQLASILHGNPAWLETHIKRLEESAWLLDQQHVDTFRNLAATAASSLKNIQESPAPFTRAYARKSILEAVLRLYKLQSLQTETKSVGTISETLIQELKGRFGV